jgi:hypothetical protein
MVDVEAGEDYVANRPKCNTETIGPGISVQSLSGLFECHQLRAVCRCIRFPHAVPAGGGVDGSLVPSRFFIATM